MISGLPVPPGFIITTEAAQECADSGFHLCDNLINEYTRAIHNLERQTGLVFGSVDDAPLLVAVRAGSSVPSTKKDVPGPTSAHHYAVPESWKVPGVSKTFLNIG